MKIVFSPKCLEYHQFGHPENPTRVRVAYEFLKNKVHRFYEFTEAKSCSIEDLLLVHSKEHIDNIKNGNFFDYDTPALPNIFNYAKLSAGAAIQAAEFVINGENAFSLMRPPGHHATKDKAMGFCYLNNIAIAVAKLLKEGKASKVAILDIDVHHGNGTQEIFLGKDYILYISLHQFPHYPLTGQESEKNCLNYCLQAGSDEKEYLSNIEKALKDIKSFNPDMLAISAGFDTYEQDMLSDINLKITTYRKIGRRIKELKLPWFAVLEGGYTSKLSECIYEFLSGLR
jgi:acetoin utilization deacetylase AcuC-like enzyme